MTKIRKFLLVILATIATLCLCFAFAACGGQQNEQNGQTKYDVAIRVACSDGEVYEFPVGTDEKHVTIVYTGTERTYRVVKYQLIGFSDEWIDQINSPYSPQHFSINILKGNDGEGYENVDNITDQGDYLVQVRTDYSILSLVDYKKWSLYIKVEGEE